MPPHAYCAERDRYDASDDHDNDDNLFSGLGDRLAHDTPECWTSEGAAAALRLVAADVTESSGGWHRAVLASVMTFVVSGISA